MRNTFIRVTALVRVFVPSKNISAETKKAYEQFGPTAAESAVLKGRRSSFRIVRNGVMSLALMQSALAFAGSVAGTGGATEITQLLNHAELVSSVAQQAQMVEQEIQAQITRLQNLAQVPGQMISQTIAPYAGQISSFQSLYSGVSQLQQAAQATSQMFGRAMSEMSATNMTPSQWLSAYSTLAKTQGGLYQQQLNQDMNSLSGLVKRAQNLQDIQSQIPNVTGNVQGLQMLNQQTNVLAGEMVDLHALVQRQVSMKMQDKLDQSQARSNAALLLQARSAKAAAINAQEQSTIQNAPAFQLLRDQ